MIQLYTAQSEDEQGEEDADGAVVEQEEDVGVAEVE